MLNLTNVSLAFTLVLLIFNFVWMFYWFNCNLYTETATARNRTAEANTYVAAQLKDDVRHGWYSGAPMQQVNATPQIAFSSINFNLGRWDNQRLYRIYDYAIVGDQFTKASANSDVCLATQSSIERLHSLVQVTKQWTGPISAAVFAAGSDEFQILQYYVTYLRLCYRNIRENVVFHLAVPSDLPPLKDTRKGNGTRDTLSCQHPESTLRKLLQARTQATVKWRLKNVYPQNHLRNVARKGCQNKYVFVTDMDIIPSRGIAEQLNKFLKDRYCHNQCAYVIPTYEVDLRANFPSSKNELLRLVKRGLARPFHEKVFIYNQFATNFSRWQTHADSDMDVHISHNVTNFEFLYEPFYVATDLVPLHDERFLGYGFTRNSQVYEMYIAGYEFYVLSPVFTCHWGLQKKKARPVWREQQNNINRKRFETFKREIFARYKTYPQGARQPSSMLAN